MTEWRVEPAQRPSGAKTCHCDVIELVTAMHHASQNSWDVKDAHRRRFDYDSMQFCRLVSRKLEGEELKLIIFYKNKRELIFTKKIFSHISLIT